MNFYRNNKSPSSIEESIKKNLTEPFIPEFTEYVQKIRRNSMAISSISLVMLYTGISITSSFSSFGFQITGLNTKNILLLLWMLTAYWLIHFLWVAADYFLEWRLRLSGVKVQPYTWDARADAVKPLDRNFTFMNWVYFETEPVRDFQSKLKNIQELITSNAQLSEEQVTHISQNIASGVQALQNFQHTRATPECENSMIRFESWWLFLKRSQGLRWLTLELFLPTGLGLWAFIMLTIKYLSLTNSSSVTEVFCQIIKLHST